MGEAMKKTYDDDDLRRYVVEAFRVAKHKWPNCYAGPGPTLDGIANQTVEIRPLGPHWEIVVGEQIVPDGGTYTMSRCFLHVQADDPGTALALAWDQLGEEM